MVSGSAAKNYPKLSVASGVRSSLFLIRVQGANTSFLESERVSIVQTSRFLPAKSVVLSAQSYTKCDRCPAFFSQIRTLLNTIIRFSNIAYNPAVTVAGFNSSRNKRTKRHRFQFSFHVNDCKAYDFLPPPFLKPAYASCSTVSQRVPNTKLNV